MLIIDTIKELKSEILSDCYLNSITNFECYEKELESFLKEDALENQKQGISKTYLFFYENNLVGYVTLLTDTLRLEGELREFFKSKDILYKTLPAIKIGRLAVDDKFQRQGIGKNILEYALILTKMISQEYVGCRFLIVDAKRNQDHSKDSVHFYKRFGFRTLKERSKGTLPMYLDIYLK